MSHSHLSYLQEMGIQSWELTHAERLKGYQPSLNQLPSHCRLVLVSDEYPTAVEVAMFDRVINSFHVINSETCFIHLAQLMQFDLSTLEWLWFAGCKPLPTSVHKQLVSPHLRDIDGNTQQRRALWQQICSYED
ncbi:DNA polymerase III subunit psi [Vibrio tritonius]|uniref:DNA polymerase III subunit psi n=1 Tax=Vibrio tritonius TaxID=1435069 RepID=UPI0008399CCA|nr:DNA polymerase III subunit psi [Vibrio tritonius]